MTLCQNFYFILFFIYFVIIIIFIHHLIIFQHQNYQYYIKDVANRSKNRNNICLTLAKRHQYYMYLQHESPSFIDTDVVQYSKGKHVAIQTLDEITLSLLAPFHDQHQNVTKANAIVVNGVRYCTGCAVVLSYEDDSYIFGKIKCAIICKWKRLSSVHCHANIEL